MKSGISLQESWHNLLLNLLIVLYCSAPIGLGSLFLLLTPKLWQPSVWGSIWAKFASYSYVLDSFPVEEESQGQCMTFQETESAIFTDDIVTSKLFGQGVFLGWLLLTYSAAISSITKAKCASNSPQKLRIDWELIPVISYPIIAAVEILSRLISCKVNPSATAATSVIFTSLSIFGPTCRLSVQREGADLVELLDGFSWFRRNMRFVAWLVPCWVCHAILAAIISEPYSNVALIRTLYPLLFLIVAYSGLVGESQFKKGKYITPYRPWQERVTVFCLAQVVFMTVMWTTRNDSLWPRSLTRLLEFDQAAALACAASYVLVSNRSYFVTIWEQSREVLHRIVNGSMGQEGQDVGLLNYNK